ncbi:MAG: hypothetical protein A2X56_12145 [Nitrospirae bacterium GWC2_57_13]|jgi:Na+/phosphate symporter|nr:MAG: hypothetical protein A2X56_12145 [Nitrospirae bacterium GWC2_57_13]OGW42429.1 MAG: hypothetical protein A2X57_07750 [Nitrospirae bacterium GWD2_57_8]HAS53639.1 hypothetical protein [Nitrospiraceae bacterium]
MPAQTVKDIKKDIYLLLNKAGQMLELTEEAFAKNKVSSLDQADELAREIHSKEDALTEVLAKLASSDAEGRTLLPVPGYVEKIATSIERIMDNTRGKIKDALLVSDKGMQETAKLFSATREVLKKAGEAVVTGTKAGADAVVKESDAVINMSNDFATSHEDRLVTGECSPKSSSMYLCVLYAFEDIAGHAKEVTKKLSK